MQPDSDRNRIRSRAAWISLGVGLFMFCIKMGGYLITHSTAILSDALESVVHVLATGFAFFSVWLSSQPADRSHPYGHGKIEFFSAGFEGGFILLAAASIVYSAVVGFFVPRELLHLDLGIWITLVAAVINLFLGWYLITVGRNQNSLTLEADGHHVLTDSITSFGVLGGLIVIAITNWVVWDSIMALFVAANISATGIKLVRQSARGLMDTADVELTRHIVDILNTHRQAEWIDIHHMRNWRAGEIRHLDFHLMLPYYFDIARAHEIEASLKSTIQQNIQEPVEFLIHHDPCTPHCCNYCGVEPCAVRNAPCSIQLTFSEPQITRTIPVYKTSSETEA